MYVQLDLARKSAFLLGVFAAFSVGPGSFAQKPARSEAAPSWVRQKVEAKNTRRETFTSKTIGQEASYYHLRATGVQAELGRTLSSHVLAARHGVWSWRNSATCQAIRCRD